MKKFIFLLAFFCSFYSIKAQETTTLPFDSIGNYTDGLAPALYEGKWGYINESKELVTPIEFDTAYSFSRDTAVIKILGNWFYVVKKKDLLELYNRESKQFVLLLPKGNIDEYISRDLAGDYKNLLIPTSDEKILIDVLKAKNDSLVRKGYNKEIAGLLAAIIVFKKKNNFNGLVAQMGFDKYNANFKTVCPRIYSGIGKLILTTDRLGNVNIKTSDGYDVKIAAALKIKNNSSFTLTENEGKYYLKNIKGIEALGSDVIIMELHPTTGKMVTTVKNFLGETSLDLYMKKIIE